MTPDPRPAPTDWDGVWYDGRSAERHAVRVRVTATGIHVERAGGGGIAWAFGDLRQTQGARPGEPARLERRGDPPEVLVVEAPGFLTAVRRIAPHYGRRFTDPARRRGRVRAAVLGAVAILAAVAGAYVWLIPALAHRVAGRVPVEWEESLGRGVMERLTARAEVCPYPAALGRMMDRLTAAASGRYTYRVTVVNDRLVNAFAAPGGYIVVFRGLIELAETPEELAGVLAHEMQHVELRHGTEAILREVPLRLVVASVSAGGARGIVGAAATLGILRYGRAAETAADRAGMRMLRDARVDPRGMVTLFDRLERRSGDGPEPASYLSTHPRTGDRIARLSRLAAEAGYEPVPLLDAGEWAQVREACGAGE